MFPHLPPPTHIGTSFRPPLPLHIKSRSNQHRIESKHSTMAASITASQSSSLLSTIPKPTHFLTTSPSSLRFSPLSLSPLPTPSPFLHSSNGNKDHLSSLAPVNAVNELVGSLTRVQGLRFAIVVARFNEIVTRPLLEGALATFKRYSVDEDIDVVWVPGSYELGIVAQRLGKSGKYHAIVCIGAVVRGDTTHYDAVANSAASGVLSAGINSGVPCVFGVLTCDDMDQAINRAGGKAGNKGSEAALTAIEMASLFEHHLNSIPRT